MKAYTDIEQSKKLAEILPLESADMVLPFTHKENNEYVPAYTISRNYIEVHKKMSLLPAMDKSTLCKLIQPCWSLTALLEVLPKKYYPIKDHETNLILGKPKDKWQVLYWDATGMQDGEQTLEDNPVDACYEMILKLHEEKLL